MIDEKHNDRMLSHEDMADYLNCTRKHIYDLISEDPSFPKSYNISKGNKQHARRWFKKDIDDWLRSRQTE